MSTEPAIRAMLLTAPGAAAIAVVRIDGPGVVSFLRAHFTRSPVINKPIHGDLRDGDRVIDDPVVALLSETQADVCLHGGAWVIHAFLQLAERAGFAIINPAAGPLPALAIEGETEIDREVAAYLPMARTELALRVLLAQPAAWNQPPSPQRGEGGGEGRNVQSQTTSDRASRSGNDSANPPHSTPSASPLTQPLPSGERGRILADRALFWLLHPPRVAIIGTANVGKSTLANQLFARERVITADRPGTTRDWVGEIADINGLAVMLVDTPGVRETSDALERQAIALSQPVVEQADLVIVVLDPTQPMNPEQSGLLERFPDAIKVTNKSDRGSLPIEGAIQTVAVSGRGIDELRHRIAAHFNCDEIEINRPRIWTERQRKELATDEHR